MKQFTFIAAAVVLVTLVALVLVQFTYGGATPEIQLRDRASLTPQPPGTLAFDRFVPAPGRIRTASTSSNLAGPLPAPANTLPIVVDLNVGESQSFILRDGGRRTVTLKETRLAFASGGVTVWATATVEVTAAPSAPTATAVIPAAYFRAPAVLNGVRVYVAITKEFNDGALRDGGATPKAARLVLSDARYTLTDVSKYQWPFPNLVWQEGSNVTYWQGLQGEPGSLFHHGGIDIGMPKYSPVHAWAGGTLAALDRGYDRIVWLDRADDGQPGDSGNRLLHLQDVQWDATGKRVNPGDLIGTSGGSVSLSGQIQWWHVHVVGGMEWGPMLAEWYTAHATPKALSYIKDWLVAGPFNNQNDEARITSDYLGNEAKVEPRAGEMARDAISWKTWDNVVPGVVSIGDAIDQYPFSGWAWVNGNYPTGAAYLATYVYSKEQRSAVLQIGSSDAFKVWIRDQELFSESGFVVDGSPGAGRTINLDAYKVPVRLEGGWNRLLVKVAQRGGAPKSWQLSVRIADEAGSPIPDLRISSQRDASASTVLPALPLSATPGPTDPPAAAATTPTALPTPVPTPAPTPQPAWAEMAGTPDGVAQGGALTTDGRYIYALRGEKSKSFWRYDPEANIWEGVAAPPAPVNQGGALAYANGGVYAFRGDSNAQFWRYDTASNSWVVLRAAPGSVGFGGALAWNGAATLYALQGTNTHDPQNLQVPNGFWKYNLGANAWTTLQALPVRVYKGGALTVAAGRPYAFPGGGSRSFWFYDEPSGTWGQAAELPEPMDNGGALLYPGSGDYIYALRGGASRQFWRYSIRQNMWERLTDTPLPVGDGAALTVQGGTLYVLPGGGRNDFWKLISSRLPSSGQPPPEDAPPSSQPGFDPVPAPTSPPTPQPTPAPTPAPSPQPTEPPTPEPCVPIVLIKVCP